MTSSFETGWSNLRNMSLQDLLREASAFEKAKIEQEERIEAISAENLLKQKLTNNAPVQH